MLNLPFRLTTAALFASALALPAAAQAESDASRTQQNAQNSGQRMSSGSSAMSGQSMDPNNVDAVVVIRRTYLMDLDPSAADTSFKRAMRENQQGRHADAARSLRQAGTQTRLEAARSTSPQDQQRLNQQAEKIERAAAGLDQGQPASDQDLQQLSSDTQMMLSESRYNQSSSTWSGRNQAADYTTSSRNAADDMRAAGEFRNAAGMDDDTSKQMRKLSRDMQNASVSAASERQTQDSLAARAKDDFDVRFRRQLTRRPATDQASGSTSMATPEADRRSRASSTLDAGDRPSGSDNAESSTTSTTTETPEVGQDARPQGLNEGAAADDPYGGTVTQEDTLPTTGTQ